MQPFKLVDRNLKFEGLKIMNLPWLAILGAAGLAFPLSLLMFMDQNISSAMVNSPANKYNFFNLIKFCYSLSG